MNSCFPYTFGYINLDSENLYLSNTGNISELKALRRRGEELPFTSKWRKIIIFALFLAGPLSLARVVPQISYENFLRIAFWAVLLYIFIAVWFIRRELGPRYFIPLKEIIRLEEKSKGLIIHFRNKHNQETEQFLRMPSTEAITAIQARIGRYRNH